MVGLSLMHIEDVHVAITLAIELPVRSGLSATRIESLEAPWYSLWFCVDVSFVLGISVQHGTLLNLGSL